MKRFTVIFLVFMFGAVSVAQAQQGFRVSVLNDAQDPLIGAYIYVNDKPTAATDMLGLAVIPLEKIKLGDSISVSYIATKGQSVVVDQVILTKGEYQFVLEESHGTLHADAVTVKANVKRLYDRRVRRVEPHPYYGLYSTHFTMNITNPGDSVPSHWVAGRVEGVYTSIVILRRMFPSQYDDITMVQYFHNPDPDALDSLKRKKLREGFVTDLPLLEVTTNDDTTNMEHILKYFLPRALQANQRSLLRVCFPRRANYGYRGKDQHHRIFSLTYPTHKVVVKADIESREVQEVTLNFEDTINNRSYYVKSKVRDEIIWEHKCPSYDFSRVWQVPTELEYRIKESDGTVVKITMSNIHTRSAFEKLKVPVDVIFSQNPHKYIISGSRTQNRLDFYYHEVKFYLERMAHEKKRREAREPKKVKPTKQKKMSEKKMESNARKWEAFF